MPTKIGMWSPALMSSYRRETATPPKGIPHDNGRLSRRHLFGRHYGRFAFPCPMCSQNPEDLGDRLAQPSQFPGDVEASPHGAIVVFQLSYRVNASESQKRERS